LRLRLPSAGHSNHDAATTWNATVSAPPCCSGVTTPSSSSPSRKPSTTASVFLRATPSTRQAAPPRADHVEHLPVRASPPRRVTHRCQVHDATASAPSASSSSSLNASSPRTTSPSCSVRPHAASSSRSRSRGSVDAASTCARRRHRAPAPSPSLPQRRGRAARHRDIALDLPLDSALAHVVTTTSSRAHLFTRPPTAQRRSSFSVSVVCNCRNAMPS
jgi:hypothetical protein